MIQELNIIAQTRSNFIRLIDELSAEQVNYIPAGFNNNIIWNFAHTISAQQILCYTLSGLSPVVDENFIELFKKGTKPEQFIDENKIAHIKKLATVSLEKFKVDFADNLFTSFAPYTTSFNVSLTCIEDAIRFVSVHEGLHLGYAMALRKLAINN